MAVRGPQGTGHPGCCGISTDPLGKYGLAKGLTVAELIQPANIRLDRQAKKLVITWSDGMRHGFPLDFLRSHCPSAGEKVARENPNTDPLAILGKVPSSEVTDLRMVGNYALGFTWADGHNAGIYTWELLRELANDNQVEKSAFA